MTAAWVAVLTDPQVLDGIVKYIASPLVGALGGMTGHLVAMVEHDRPFTWRSVMAFSVLGAVVGGYGVGWAYPAAGRQHEGRVFLQFMVGSIGYQLWVKGEKVFVSVLLVRFFKLFGLTDDKPTGQG
jgi:hypothetical protein